MDKQSHYKWELTNDELNTIWYALTDRADRLYREANAPGVDPALSATKRRLAENCQSLYAQINRMKQRGRW